MVMGVHDNRRVLPSPGGSLHIRRPLAHLMDMQTIPTFMLRGHPDCKVEAVEVLPARKHSPEFEARKTNRDCAERLAYHHKKFLAQARKDRKANKIKKALDAILPEHRY